jgi:hypothetical protein
MSKKRALQALNLETTDKIAVMELLEAPQFVRRLTGIDPYEHPLQAFAEAHRMLDIDLCFPGKLPFSLPRTDAVWALNHAEWASGKRFSSTRDVLTYDPAAELSSSSYLRWLTGVRTLPGVAPERWPDPESPSFVETIAEVLYRPWKMRLDAIGDATLLPGVYGLTLFHYLVNTFGFEWSCLAAVEDPPAFRGLLDRFAQISCKIIEAWAMLPIEAFISHDDLAMQSGTIFAPDWYRENIFPWYPEIWKPLKKKGIKILFWSDGNYTSIMDDVIAAGADGVAFEPMVDLATVVRKWGGKKAIVGNASSGILTHGSRQEIESEVERCYKVGGSYPGYFFCATGSILDNMPVGHPETYFQALSRCRQRVR